MRGRLLNLSAIGRAAGFALVAATIIAAAVHLGHGVRGDRVATRAAVVGIDPLAAALVRCQAIGLAAQTDGACEAAWAENRRRFFEGRRFGEPRTMPVGAPTQPQAR